MMSRILFFLALTVVLLVVVVTARTLRSTSKQVPALPASGPVVDARAVAEKLTAAIRIPTVTYQDTNHIDMDALVLLHDFLEESYPRVHRSLRREVIAGHSLLYTWPGEDEDLSPLVLTGHLDVVPVPPETEEAWAYPPFEGHVAEGYVWGRGALDDKNAVVCLLEAIEGLLAGGYRPRRSVYLAFGHDEERGGYRGARQIAETLRERGVQPAFVLDEGLFITEGLVPGVAAPVALVGTAEKGVVSVELSVAVEGGHASMPPRETALGLLSRAVARLEANPLPARMEAVARAMFDYVAPEMELGGRLAFANLWLFGPLVRRRLAASPSTDALLRTTTAPTIMQGGAKENVLPGRARAVLNFRILPGDTVAGVVAHLRRTVDDERIAVRVLEGASEASPVSPSDAPAFGVLQRVIRSVFPGVVVAPSLMIARTDARHYTGLTDHVFRFSPVWMRREDLGRLHGVDERIALGGLAQSVRFYHHLIRTASDGPAWQ